MAVLSDIDGISPTVFLCSALIFFIVTKTIFWFDKKVDELLFNLETELMKNLGERKKGKSILKRRISYREDTKSNNYINCDAFKIVWPRLKQKYLHTRITLTKNTSLKSQKEISKRIELINRRRSSTELLNLEMQISKILKKHKKPNRFYQLACTKNLNSINDLSICDVNRLMKEIEKKQEHKTISNLYNFMRNINIPTAYAYNIISDIEIGRGKMSYYQNECTKYRPTNFYSFSTRDLTKNSKFGYKINNSLHKKIAKHYDKAKQSCKNDYPNYGLRSHCKIMEIIRIFVIGKMLNLKSLNSSKNMNKKYNNINNSFNIIYAVKKYSPLFTEREKDNFLKSIVTPKTKKKLYERISMDSLSKDGSKIPSHASRFSFNKNVHFNKRNCERVRRLINFRTKLNACLQHYYSIRPGSNNNLMKFWNILRNGKFNLFNKNKALGLSNMKDFNLYVIKNPLRDSKCRKGKPLNHKKIHTNESKKIIYNHKLECSISRIYSSSCISSKSHNKFMRSSKINCFDNEYSSREGKNSLDIIGTESFNKKLISENIFRLNLNYHRKLPSFLRYHNTKLMNKNGSELFITDRVSTENFLKINWNDNLIQNKIGIQFSVSNTDLHERKENIPVRKLRSLPIIKYNINKAFTTRSKIADLEERIKKSKAIINPIKSTITNYVINANHHKTIEFENESLQINSSSNSTEVSYSNLDENSKPVRQLYKNPNFHKSFDGRNRNFIARNILSIKEASQQTRLKLNKEKENKTEGTAESKKRKSKIHKFKKCVKSVNNTVDSNKNSVETIFFKGNTKSHEGENDINSLSSSFKENIKNISDSEEKILTDSDGKSDIHLKKAMNKKTKLVNKNINSESTETNLSINKYNVENSISKDDIINNFKPEEETDCETNENNKMDHMFEQEFLLKKSNDYRKRAANKMFKKMDAELINNTECNKIIITNETISRSVETDKIIERIAESCERFQNMQENEVIVSNNDNFTFGRNLIMQEPEYLRKDYKYSLGSRRHCPFELHNRLKKYKYKWENKSKIWSDRGSESIKQLYPSNFIRKGRKLNKFKGKSFSGMETTVQRGLRDLRNQPKKEWKHEFYYKANGMKNVKPTKKSPIKTKFYDETQIFTLLHPRENKNEQNDKAINFQLQEIWPNGYSSKDFNDNFKRYLSNESSEITISTDSQENFDCETTSSSSDWLISEVFNVDSCECTKFNSKERKKRFRKTRLQEYLRRFSCESEFEQPYRVQNPISATQLSIFPPLLE